MGTYFIEIVGMKMDRSKKVHYIQNFKFKKIKNLYFNLKM